MPWLLFVKLSLVRILFYPLGFLCGFCLLSSFSLAQSSAPTSFPPTKVEEIRVEGIVRTEVGTVFGYLPIKVGDTINTEKATEVIKALFATGFFRDVGLDMAGNILIVRLEERPAIATIDYVGLRTFDKDQLKQINTNAGLAIGRIFDRSILERAEQELKQQYLGRGLYGVGIKTTITPLERNRVGLLIQIDEGDVTTIRKINIVGNKAFTTNQLLGTFEQSESGLFSWYSKNDQYSRQKLSADLESLRSFYLNRGYMDFAIESAQVLITPDKKHIHLSISINEGEIYTISAINIAGATILPLADIRPLVTVKAGDVFNGEKIAQTTKKIQERLGEEGYAFAQVNPTPKLDREQRKAELTFAIDPGRRVYVRRILIGGNVNTRDEVIRRELPQMEASFYNSNKIAEGRRRLERLNYFKETKIEPRPVPGVPDQVDLQVQVEERSTGAVTAGAGYSSTEKLVFQTSFEQANVFGTGNTLGLALNTGRINRVISLSHTNPYVTVDGVSRSFDVYRRDTNAANLSLGDYSTRSYGGNIRFGYPYTSIDTLIFGVGFDRTQYFLEATAPSRVVNYTNQYGSSIDSVPGTISWVRDSRDSALAPTSGYQLTTTLEVGLPVADVRYAKVYHFENHYFRLSDTYTLRLRADIGFGRSLDGTELPIFKKFYAGGIGSVRGFDSSSLGPRDTDSSILGGDKRITGTVEVLFPFPGLTKDRTLRLAWFIDGGQVYGNGLGDYTRGPRFSTGVGFTWFSPIGPLALSWAKPIEPESSDRIQRLQFTIGTTF